MWLEMFVAGQHGKLKTTPEVRTKVILKDCSADTTALFPTLYKYIHRQYFLLFLFMIIEAECNLYKSLVVL